MGRYNNTLCLQDIFRLLFPAGLLTIILFAAKGSLPFSLAFGMLPLLGCLLVAIVRNPLILFYFLFTINYFILGITRYVPINGVSLITDILIAALVILIVIHGSLYRNIRWKQLNNPLIITSIVWGVYCIIEVINPTGVFSAWVLSRGLILTGIGISFIVSLLMYQFRQVQYLVILLAIFSVLAITKTIIQKYIGFDTAEWRWLNEVGGKTHLIMSGTRYFSFFPDAANMGSNMGASALFFGIISFYCKNRITRIFYLIVSFASCYAMFLSGTRGAIIVPLAGIAAYIVLNKNFRIMILGGTFLMVIYVFFAYTTIGHSNPYIRRMRTAFKPNEDASYIVRKQNQQLLSDYLKNRPFGEGLGLSGVENQKVSYRLTTAIPNDSWFVKIWVETGITGLILYLAMLIITFMRAAWLIMFRIKNKQVKGYMIAFLCGVFGLSVSAYGNPFWGQYPTHILVFTLMAILMNGEIIDKNLTEVEPEL